MSPASSNESLYTEKEITVSDALDHGLSEEEYKKIQEFLGGRNPTVTELGIYSGLWSEHCSYKNSILQLKTLPTQSARALTKTGEENAGALDIGDGLAVVFKIESHNHPTAIEPYQGAATGVGGIMRDIFTMGARPIASLNSLRFGPPDDPKNRHLLKRAVKGIGDYGNCLGIAVSGGELFFDPSFSRNCLVNAMTVGIVRHDKMAKAVAKGPGNPVFIVGATTGRDGIHGASFASRDLSAESESKRSAVQVGDPFMEKLLLEATLELVESGVLIGIQDMGAAGLSCASSEMSAKGGTGMDINLDLVPLREEGMNAYEIMLSESQERMLVVLPTGKEDTVISIFTKWGLNAVRIGHVTHDGILRVRRNGKLCSAIPSDSLVLGGGAPRYVRETSRPEYLDTLARADLSDLEKSGSAHKSADLEKTLLSLLASPNICSRRPVYEQYDTEVGLVRIIGPGGDGGVARVPGTSKGIAVSTDCNSRYVYLNPRIGTAQAVCESARNVAVAGARPIGITNCLNFGNPYIKENYYIFSECIAGMREGCLAFDIPVTGGNVSFYNESQDGPVKPTPTIGMVGLIEDVSLAVQPFFAAEESEIFLAGRFAPSFGGSEFLSLTTGRVEGQIPELDLSAEKNLVDFLCAASDGSLLLSARDLSLGGLATALFRSAYNHQTRTVNGFVLYSEFIKKIYDSRGAALAYFGETNGCAILSARKSDAAQLIKTAEKFNVPLFAAGCVSAGSSVMDFSEFKMDGKKAAEAYEGGLADYL